MKQIFPVGKVVHVTVSASSIKMFSSTPNVSRESVTCFRCAEQGHWKYECMLYKTRLCWHNKFNRCTETDCPFAHNEHEMRYPWKPKCVRVIKKEGKLIKLGCGSTDHTFRLCPHTWPEQ